MIWRMGPFINGIYKSSFITSYPFIVNFLRTAQLHTPGFKKLPANTDEVFQLPFAKQEVETAH